MTDSFAVCRRETQKALADLHAVLVGELLGALFVARLDGIDDLVDR